MVQGKELEPIASAEEVREVGAGEPEVVQGEAGEPAEDDGAGGKE